MDESRLPLTEQVNNSTEDIDVLSTEEILHRINDEDRRAAWAVEREIDVIATAVDAITERLRVGGKLHYFGAGTSGRLAMLDAAEIPPTFGVQDVIIAHVAGGAAALAGAVEGAEDDVQSGNAAVDMAAIGTCEVAIGVSASGRAPFVLAAVNAAASKGALTICITSNPNSPLACATQIPIVLRTGPEVIAGSTRMKAAAAQKMALTMISTAVMIKLGKVYGNLMVDVEATNSKLRDRALRLTARLTAGDPAEVKAALEQTSYRVKPAVVMLWCHCDARQAQEKLERAGGNLRTIRAALGSPA
jgi:N-acetylmuramic acid 6-phosphate etherase